MSDSQERAAPHVVVCGAGVIGAATAFFLSERGARVSIVEEGGSCRGRIGKVGRLPGGGLVRRHPAGPACQDQLRIAPEIGLPVRRPL